MDKNVKIMIIGLVVLILFVPIGLIATGTAYGEWGSDYLQDHFGFIPSGFNGLQGLWSAPLQDYGLPGQGDTMADMTPGYYLSAIVGVVLAGGLLYLGAKMLVKNKD